MSKQLKKKSDAKATVKKADAELSDDESSSSVGSCPYASKSDSESSSSESESESSSESEVDDAEALKFFKKQGSSKPNVATHDGMLYRRGRYLAAKEKSGAKAQSFKEWKKSSYETAVKGGRPGRGGGPHQKARRMKLEQQGYENIETVELNGRYPDMRKEIGTDKKGQPLYEYVEVGIMNLDGKPCSRELTKLKDSVQVLKPKEKITFVGNDGRKVTYNHGTKPSEMDKKHGPRKTAEKREQDCDNVAEEMGTKKEPAKKKQKITPKSESESDSDSGSGSGSDSDSD